MSQQQREALDQLLRDGPPDIGGDVDVQRRIFEEMAGAQPLPDDAAVTHRVLGGPVFFLASDDAGFITGQTLNVDGGQHLL